MPRAAVKQDRSRGQIIAKGIDKWLVRVYVGRDANGKRKYDSKTVLGKHSQAQRELTKLLGSVDTGVHVTPAKVTLAEYLTGAKLASDVPADVEQWGGWMEGKRGLGPKTRRSYAERITKDILPQLGNRRLDTITHDDVNRWVTWMVETRKIGPRTIQYSLVVLKGALEDAVRHGKLARNAASHVEPPKADVSEMTVLTAEQISGFLVYSAGSPRHVLWATLLTSGARPQEALALQWTDLDVLPDGTGILRITKAMVEVTAGHREVGPTKTGRTRSVGIPEEVVKLLQAHRAKQNLKILKAGPKYDRRGFIFAGTAGAPLDMSAVRRKWKADLKAAKLPEVRLYGARHSHATALLGANVHPKVASERLGHSSTKLTMDTYSHVLHTMQQQATDVVGSLMFNRKPGASEAIAR